MNDGTTSVSDLTEHTGFIRWVEGKASAEEARLWDQWIRQSPVHEQLARAAQERVLGTDFVHRTVPNSIEEWSRLTLRLNGNGPLQFIFSKLLPRRKGRDRVIKIAAVALITMFLGVTSYLMVVNTQQSNRQAEHTGITWNRIETGFGELKEIDLSDGSSITLNANSSLTYPEGWITESGLDVYLEGEAYFSVASRSGPGALPFRVITEDGTVEVLGTRFMVSAGRTSTRVVLEEGVVTIMKNSKDSDAGTGDSEGYRMEPNELARFSQNSSSVSISDIPNTRIFTSWTDRMLVLDSSPFAYLVERIKNTYGVRVEVYDNELYERKLTGSIKLKKLDYLTRALSDVMGIEVTQSGGTVYFGKVNSK